ncbi:methyltransferase domain-containing protein [Streptacidiphilus griseoplanus]|uniref:methyltransferase domain-containing protein n=1 Tax=Peterkaempfera griseoplana TaxID=66896 RepID=UPI0007C72A45|nr:methyltransferase domain-containing protein [Peterkaempfera griseoplana]
MVARLEQSGVLHPGRVRDALLALPREVLMPQAYVRRGVPGEVPPRWDLLDWAVPQEREELLGVVYGESSVLIQHDGERILGRTAGSRSGGVMTSMSTVMSLTAALLQQLDLRPGHRVLDVGTGAGVTAAVACHACGDSGMVTLDRDSHVADAARARLADLGYRPTVVQGDGEHGWPDAGPYDRIFVSYAAPRVPQALVDQLATGGRLLMHLTTASPSWPGLAVISRGPDGRVEGELRAVEFAHRAGHGVARIFLDRDFRGRIAAGADARTRTSQVAPPGDTERGLWLAVDHLRGGLVRDFTADALVIGAPVCGSWLRVTPDGHRRWTVTASGRRDIWTEIQDVAARWRAAGEPSTYRLSIGPGGVQTVAAPSGGLSWRLPSRSIRTMSPSKHQSRGTHPSADVPSPA